MNIYTKFCAAILLVILTVTFSASTALAQTNKAADKNATCEELKKKFENAGGSALIEDVPMYCGVEPLYTKFINMALFAAGIVAVIAVIYGGYVYMTAGGRDAQVKRGKTILIWAIIGLIVVLAAATIVNLVVTGLVENRFV